MGSRGVDEALGIGGVEAEGLLAEHVLAGLEGGDRPVDVEVVGEWVVDRVDVRISEQCLVRTVRGDDVVGLRPLGRPIEGT